MDADAQLTDYVEDLLGPDDVAAVERLLESDAARAREVALAREAKSLLQQLVPPTVPPDFARRVRRRIRQRTSGAFFDTRGNLLGFKLSVEVFAVIAVVAMCALYFIGELGARHRIPQELHEAKPVVTDVATP